MTKTFENVTEFFQHLERTLAVLDKTDTVAKDQLLHGCYHAMKYLMESQNVLSGKLYQLCDILATDHPTWGHKLSAVYQCLDAGQITPEDMNKILIEELEKTRNGQ
jgi:hypothetical protein